MADDDSSVATPETSTTAQLENQVRISRRYISETERLQARVNELEAEAQQHRSQLDGFEAWREHIVTSHQTTRQFYSHNLAATQHERDMSRAEKEELEDEKARLQARYDKLLSEKNAFEEQAMQKIEMSLHSVSNLEEQLGALQIEKEQAITSQQAANESLVVLRQEVVTHTETNATLQAQCDELQSHNQRLRHEAESANVAVIEKDQAIASLQGTNRSQEQQIAELRASLAGEREKNERSRQKMAELKQANAKSKQENELSRQKIAEFERANAEKEALAAQSKRENEALHQEIAELKHEHCNLRTLCNKLQYDKETLAANVMSAREINRRLLSEKEQERATMQERYDTLMLEQQIEAEKNIDELLEERRKLTLLNYERTLLNEELKMEVAQLKTEWLEELDELTNHSKIDRGTERNELVLPTHAQSRSVTPAHSQIKRGQSMTATTESSLAESTSPTKKRSKMSHETTSTSQPEPPATAMPDADSDESMMIVDDQAVKFDTTVDESTLLVTTQDSQATLTQREGTTTNAIVLSDEQPSTSTAIVSVTTPAITFAMEAVAEKLTDDLTPTQKIILIFPEWIRHKLFRREGAQSALDLYLSHTKGGSMDYAHLLHWIGVGGTHIWKSMFLAEYPLFDAVQLLTEKTEKYGFNGFIFKERGGFLATAALLGLSGPRYLQLLKLYLFRENGLYSNECGKMDGRVIMYHDNCHKCADLTEFKQTATNYGRKIECPPTDFTFPPSFCSSTASDLPTEDEAKSMLQHMLTLNGDYSTVFAAAAKTKMAKLAGYMGMNNAGSAKRGVVLAWFANNRSVWEKLAREKIAEVDIGDLKQFTTWVPTQPPYTEQQLTQISSILKRLGRATDGRSKIEVFLSKANLKRLRGIKRHNSITMSTKDYDCMKRMSAVILRHFASS